jgi:hypothetical protein
VGRGRVHLGAGYPVKIPGGLKTAVHSTLRSVGNFCIQSASANSRCQVLQNTTSPNTKNGRSTLKASKQDNSTAVASLAQVYQVYQYQAPEVDNRQDSSPIYTCLVLKFVLVLRVSVAGACFVPEQQSGMPLIRSIRGLEKVRQRQSASGREEKMSGQGSRQQVE